MLLLGAACSAEPPTPNTAAVSGRVGPGIPPSGSGIPARLDLVFSDGERRVEVVAERGTFQVDLTPGTRHLDRPGR